MSTVWYGTGLHKLLQAGKQITSPQSSVLGPRSSILIPRSSFLDPQSMVLSPHSSVCNKDKVETKNLKAMHFCCRNCFAPKNFIYSIFISNVANICRGGQAASCAALVWYGMVWCGMVWYAVVWNGVVWYGYGMVWYGMV